MDTEIGMGAGMYAELYAAMEGLLEAREGERAEQEGYAAEIGIVGAKVHDLKAMASQGFSEVAAETQFFRGVWPRFYGRLFFFLLADRLQQARMVAPADGMERLMRLEEARVARFFRRHREFWAYYRAGSGVIDNLFTREHSLGCIFDPLCWVLDPAGATLASCQAAWGIAYEAYGKWLQELREPARGPRPERWEWKETRSAAVELLKAMAEAGSVQVNGKSATTRQLRTVFEEKFGMEINDFDNLLYATDTRKIDATPYFTKLVQAFLGRKERLGK